MLTGISPRSALLLVSLAALATIAGAWIFEWAGYLPCPLCLWQRWPYYAVIPTGLAAAAVAGGREKSGQAALHAIAVVMAGSALFGIYHSGVEWKWWPGPGTCSGSLSGILPDLSKPVVRCDEPAIRILGLSLAGWNAIVSTGLSWFAFLAARAQGSSSVSQ